MAKRKKVCASVKSVVDCLRRYNRMSVAKRKKEIRRGCEQLRVLIAGTRCFWCGNQTVETHRIAFHMYSAYRKKVPCCRACYLDVVLTQSDFHAERLKEREVGGECVAVPDDVAEGTVFCFGEGE